MQEHYWLRHSHVTNHHLGVIWLHLHSLKFPYLFAMSSTCHLHQYSNHYSTGPRRTACNDSVALWTCARHVRSTLICAQCLFRRMNSRTQCPNLTWVAKFLHHSLSTPQKQRCPNTENLCISVLNGHVSEPCISNALNAERHTRSLIDNRISRWRHRYLKLVNANRPVFVRDMTLTSCSSSTQGHSAAPMQFKNFS